ncbi:MAG: tetratricopeptide repeat protein [bacterium]|nr:tetratricopeptide repeat protein [bacterium]
MKNYDFMKLEDYGWGFKEFKQLKGRETKDELQIYPLLSEDEIKRCFVTTKKVEDFTKKFKIENYLFLSMAGTGKTSLLSYLSVKAEKQGYNVYWIVIGDIIPKFEIFSQRLNLERKNDEKYILVFDSIHNNLDIVGLVYEIIRKHPQIKIWISARYHDMLFLKEEWEEIKDEFNVKYLPCLIEGNDIKKFLKKFKNMLNKEEMAKIAEKTKLPAIHIASIYQRLKNISSKEDKMKVIEKTPLKAQEVYLSIYHSLNDCEKFILKIIAYQDGILENSLRKAIRMFGIEEKIIYELIEKQIIYKDPSLKFLPHLQDFVALNIIDGLKENIFLLKNTFPYERENIIPDVLIKIGTVEEMITLSKKYKLFNEKQKREYVEFLKNNKQKITVFWLISNLASEGENRLLKYSNFEIEIKDNKINREIYARSLGNFGYAYFLKGDYQSSVFCFSKAIGVYSKSSRLWYNLGVVYGIKGQIYNEIICYYEAIKINRQNASAWYNLGLAYDKKGDYNKEIKCYKETIRINPNDDKAWYNLGLAYGKKGWMHEECECYEETLSLNPEDACAWYNLGIVFIETEEYHRAIQCFRDAMKINPQDPYIWYNLGISYGKINEVDKEVECFNEAVRIMPSFAKAWYNLGVIFEESGDVEKEIESFQNVVKIRSDWIEAWHNLAMAYWKKGLLEEEQRCYQKIREVNPNFNLNV